MTDEDVAVAAAEAAAALLANARPADVRHKGRIDLVTELDVACEQAIRAVLAKHQPDVPVLGEEGGGTQAATASTRWVVDPIDGTTNFVHGFPFYSVSVGLEIDGEPAVGCVIDVPRRVVYRGTAGRGATANGAPLRVSDARTLEQALCATGFAYDSATRADFYLGFVKDALEQTRGIRRAGSAALDLSMVASGALDLYWEFHLQRWDVCAGVVLVRAAGGRAEPIPGYGLESPVATNGWLHDAWVALLERRLREGG